MLTIPGISHLLVSLEKSTRDTFLPALLRSPSIGNEERALLALAPGLSGTWVISPELAVVESINSINLTRSLKEKIIDQDAQ